MLSIILFDRIHDLYKFEWIKNEETTTTVICPNPRAADDFRNRILGVNTAVSAINDTKNFTVITISKFVADELKKGFGNQLDSLRKNKSDLMIYLGTVWKKYFPELSFEVFDQVFNLFTTFRSYTLEFSLIEEILKEYDKTVADGICIFWQVLDSLAIVDEHKSYSILSEAYRINDHQVYRDKYFSGEGFNNIVFWGFTQLTAIQVDFLKALGIRHNVFIPFQESVYRESMNSDWINWLDAVEVNVAGKKEVEKVLDMTVFPAGRMNEYIDRTVDFSLTSTRVDVYLAERCPSVEQINEFPLDGLFFKAKNNFFHGQLNMIMEFFSEKYYFSGESVVETEQLYSDLDKIIKDELEKKDYRKIKICLLFKQTIDKWENISDENRRVDYFCLKLLANVCELDLPRVFSSPLLQKKPGGRISGIEELERFDQNALNIVCVTSRYSTLKSTVEKHEPKVMEFLKSIGPLHRSEFEFLILKNRLTDILQSDGAILFIENGLVDFDVGWNQVIGDFERVNISEISSVEKTKAVDLLAEDPVVDGNTVKRISASRLQAYMDCPRKYYFSYVDSLGGKISLHNSLMPDQLGILEHLTVEDYIKEYDLLDRRSVRKIAQKNLERYLGDNGIILDNYRKESYLREIVDYSSNGILPLLQIKAADGNTELKFEKEFSDKKNSDMFFGRLDCLIENTNMMGIVDFKRSAASIPRVGDLMNMEKIQLWFYLNHNSQYLDRISFYGFCCLSDVEKSVIFCSSESVYNRLKEIKFMGEKRIIKRILEPKEFIAGYSLHEEKIVERMKKENNYDPIPATSDVCKYCQVKNLCSRSVIQDEKDV